MIPARIRVSVGTASVLGLIRSRLDVKPSTAYLMTYTDNSCIANCSFCPQARESQSKKTLLSRVVWPTYPTMEVIERIGKASNVKIERVCIQAINYPGFIEDVNAILEGIKGISGIPVSLDSPPLDREAMMRLKRSGLERISFPFDAATPELFDRVKGENVKGPYLWENHMKALRTAVEIFGPGNAMSNIIVGLGESEEEAVRLIQRLLDMRVETSLFAFTPIPGTQLAKMRQPPLGAYRRIQMARYLITNRLARYEDMEFDDGGRVLGFGLSDKDLKEAARTGDAFQTCGCPGCNRPYYNERPSGPFYNYPRRLTSDEVQKEAELLKLTDS